MKSELSKEKRGEDWTNWPKLYAKIVEVENLCFPVPSVLQCAQNESSGLKFKKG